MASTRSGMSQVTKQPLDARRLRQIPAEGFSWIDRRLFREGFAQALTGPELLFYLFLCSVSDQEGLSFYGDRKVSSLLKLGEVIFDQARRGLLRKGLILYRHPLYQVLPLPDVPNGGILEHLSVAAARRHPTRHEDSTRPVGEILEKLL